MRKVVLRMNEQFKYEIIKKLVDSNGNKKNAALKLNCTVRTINRLILLYKNEGKDGFVHKNRNRKPSTTIPEEIKHQVIDLYRTKYLGSNFTHFSELLLRDENISVSDSTIRKWLFDVDVLSPKARRKTVKKLKCILKDRKKQSKSNKEIVKIENKLELLDRSEAHPRRPRCAYFGEMFQMDASPHLWFGDVMTSPTASSIPRHLSPTTNLTPSKPRPRSH